MIRESLDIYDELPEDMIQYLRYNGRHFNRKLVKFAISLMKVRDSNGAEMPVDEITKDELDRMLEHYNIKIDNNQGYDYVYVANMCKADFLGSSVVDEAHLCLYVKDVIDDIDGYDGIVFNRWYADMCRNGIVINWYDVL